MKSLKDISWQVDEDTYRKDSALSYSTISRYNREGFDNLSHLFDKVESPSLLFGSIVDCLLTGTEEEFESRFLVADFPEITDSQRKVVEYLFKIHGNKNIPLDKLDNSYIISATELLSFQLNWKPETRAKVIKENCSEFWDLLTLAMGKTVISQSLYKDALECKEKLKTSEATVAYFADNNPFNKSIERLYQLKFKGKYNDIPLRCMADLIVVDYENKIIYPCDLKTSFKPEWRFYKSFIEWGYWIQAQLYWYIIRQCMDADDFFKDFKLADYTFIVISNRTKQPLVWRFSYTKTITDITIGKHFLKNWRNIVPELYSYINKEHSVPEGIFIDKANDITKWLEDERD